MIESGLASAPSARHRAIANNGGSTGHIFRKPVSEDGHAISTLIAACPPLDPNSIYCNLLQCTHFADTCIVAEKDGAIEGWISGYRPPSDPEALFIWQVAIDERARGCGLGVAMLGTLIRRPAAASATRMLTTITRSNLASRRMFARFAQSHAADLRADPGFDDKRHFGGGHESEELITIGPLPPRATTTI